MKRLGALVIAWGTLSNPAWSQIDAEPFSTYCDVTDVISRPSDGCVGFMAGVVSGLNTNAEFRKKVCFPDGITLRTLMETGLKYEFENGMGDVPAQMVLMLAYVDAYPCNS